MSTSVRIHAATRAQLREIEALIGAGPTEALARAVDSFRRSLLLADTDIAYAAMRRNPEAAEAYDVERAEWDSTLADGLDEPPTGGSAG